MDTCSGQELKEQSGWTADRDFLKSFVDRNRSAYHLTGLEVLDPHRTPLAASYDPRMGKLPGLPAPEPGAAAFGKCDHPAEGRRR